MDQRTKHALWIVAGVVFVVALVAHHNITSRRSSSSASSCPPSSCTRCRTAGWPTLFGDDTAKRAGRLTLNPVAHVDPVGTLIVPALLSLSGIGVFGWAKPVPVNVGRLRSPRNQGVLVSLAGPVDQRAPGRGLRRRLRRTSRPAPSCGLRRRCSTSAQVVFYASLVNVGLCVFNMIPVPPLDGSVLFERLLPARWWPTYLRYRQYTMPILLALVVLNFLLHPGPITWLFERLYNWWAGVLGV